MQDSIKEKVKEYLKIEEETAQVIFEQLSLYIYSLESGQHDLYIIAKLASSCKTAEDFYNKLISYFDGDTIKLPSKEEHRSLILLAVCYYLKIVKGYNWQQIKEFLDLPENNQNLLSSISIGGRINKLNEKISKEMLAMLKDTKIKDMGTFLQNFKEDKING